MKFHIDKYYTMQVGRKRHNILNTYTLHDHPLPITDSAKYLGVTISYDLKWNKHVSNITSKANSTLGILRQNLRLSSHTVTTHAYQALVRPHLEYEGFYNFSKVCLQFFRFLNVVFSRLFYDNITFQHLFIIIKCPAELNFDCMILIRSVPSTFVTELLLRGYVFLTFPKPTPFV